MPPVYVDENQNTFIGYIVFIKSENAFKLRN